MSIAIKAAAWIQDSNRETAGSVIPFLNDGETIVAACQAETRPPLLVRLIPLIPDIMTRAKKFLLVLTEDRLLVVRLTNPFNKLKAPMAQRVDASIALRDLAEVTPSTGRFTSSIEINPKRGKLMRFTNMLQSAAGKFAAACDDAKAR